jgi:GNAT superfamily N-acetyltransferase
MHQSLNTSATSLAIVPATAKDLPLIITLARRIWPSAYAGILTPEQIENLLERIYSIENLQNEMESGHRFWIAYDENRPVGYASGYRESADIIWLKKIYVESHMQGKGVGRQLTQAVIAAFSPARELRLLSNPKNTASHRYYAREGFAKIGEVPVKMGDCDFIDFMFSKPIT